MPPLAAHPASRRTFVLLVNSVLGRGGAEWSLCSLRRYFGNCMTKLKKTIKSLRD